jgi:hypothetical protein
LYRSEQSSNADKKPFRYEIPLANGNYFVRLHFAEIFWGAPGTGITGGPGSRVMSVTLENQLRLANLDVAGEVGTATAVIKNFPVTVTDGKLNINFSSSVNRPMVCAVEVYSFSIVTASPAMVSMVEGADYLNNFEKPQVFPNPLRNRFNIRFPTTYKGNMSLQLSDIRGRMFELGRFNLRLGGSAMEVDISKLALRPGVYFLRMNFNERKTEVMKLIVR